MVGWIALYRAITEHWVWKTSSKRFQRWVDLLFLASWRDRKTGFGNIVVPLKRGQLVTSTRELMRRWSTNNTTVTTTLNLFVENGMISMDRGRTRTIITIINYNKYQRAAIIADELSKLNIDDLSLESIDDLRSRIEQQKLASQVHNRVQSQLPIEEDNNENNKKIKTKTLSVDDAQALTHEEVFEDFFNAQVAVETFCMQNSIDVETCKKLAREVINDWELSGDTHTSLKEGRKHLLNHIRRKLTEQKRQRNAIQKKQTSKGQRGMESRTGGEAEPNPLARARVHTARINSGDGH